MVPEKEVASGGGRHTRNVFFLALILLILYILGGCASTGTTTSPPAGQKEFYVPAVDEELFGTWVNEDYRPPSFTPKVIIYPWGLVEWFADIQDKVSSWIGTSIVVEKWTDEQGATWYKDYRRGTDLSF